MEMNNGKRMVAVMKANPYRCPKCGAGLEEDDFPVTVFAENGGMWHDAETCFFCPSCGAIWYPYQIPGHPHYDESSDIFEAEQ